MWRRYLAILLLVACCLLVQASPQLYPVGLKKRVKLCGDDLVKTLAFVCQGQYNTMNKKSFEEEDYEEDTALAFPYLQRQNAAALVPGAFRRYSRGVVDECCRKSCSMRNLMLYCSINAVNSNSA